MIQDNDRGSRGELISSLLKDNRKVRATLLEMAESHQSTLKKLRSQLYSARDELTRRSAAWEAREREYEELVNELRAKATTSSMSFRMAQAAAEESEEQLRATKEETSLLRFERESALEGFVELEEVHDELESERRRLEEEYETTAVRILEMESERADLEAELGVQRARCEELTEAVAQLEMKLRTREQRMELDESQKKEWQARAQAAEAEAEKARSQEQLHYKELASARAEADQARAEIQETRQKMLNALNEAESKEMVAEALRKAEQATEEKAREAEELRAQLEQSQRSYQELEEKVRMLGKVPTGGSITELLGKLKKLRRTSADD